jgi:hypothetical protein
MRGVVVSIFAGKPRRSSKSDVASVLVGSWLRFSPTLNRIPILSVVMLPCFDGMCFAKPPPFRRLFQIIAVDALDRDQIVEFHSEAVRRTHADDSSFSALVFGMALYPKHTHPNPVTWCKNAWIEIPIVHCKLR